MSKNILSNKILNFWQNWRTAIIAPITVFILLIIIRSFGLLQDYELQVYDWYFQRPLSVLQSLAQEDDRFIIVEINEKDLQNFKKVGNYPIQDADLANLLEIILKQNPSVIGLDIYRDISIKPEYENETNLVDRKTKLDLIFETNDRVIGIEKVQGIKGKSGFEPIAPPRGLLNTNRVGANDLILDPDGFVRRGLLTLNNNEGQQKDSFSLLVADRYLSSNGLNVTQDSVGNFIFGKTVIYDLKPTAGGYTKIDTGGYQFLINWRIPPKKWEKISTFQVLNEQITPDIFKNKIVLIGVTAPSLNDYFNVPYYRKFYYSPTKTYGVEIQANLIKQFIDMTTNKRSLIKTAPDLFEWGFTFVCLSLTSIGIIKLGKRKEKEKNKEIESAFPQFFNAPKFLLYSIAIVALGLLIVFIFTYLAFIRNSFWLPVVPPALAIFFGGFATTIGIYVERIKQSNTELKKANTELEKRVKQRTEELVKANLQLEEAYKESQAKTEQLIAQEKLSSLGLIVSEIHHDLSHPIGAIQSNSLLIMEQIELYKSELGEADTQDEMESKLSEIYEFFEELEEGYLKDIVDQAQTSKRFLDSLHSHNYLNRSQQEQTLFLKKADFNNIVSEYVKIAKKVFNTKIREKRISPAKKLGEAYRPLRVIKKLEPSIPEFYMDSNALSRVVLNLVSNAFDATLEKQLKTQSYDYQPTVTITTINEPDTVKLIVEDNGEGIAKNKYVKIFDPSYTSKRKTGGTGLGLYIVYNLVTSFASGKIHVDSEVGVGTRFEIVWRKYDSNKVVVSLPTEQDKVLNFAAKKS